jgi:hypothetical protein
MRHSRSNAGDAPKKAIVISQQSETKRRNLLFQLFLHAAFSLECWEAPHKPLSFRSKVKRSGEICFSGYSYYSIYGL